MASLPCVFTGLYGREATWSQLVNPNFSDNIRNLAVGDQIWVWLVRAYDYDNNNDLYFFASNSDDDYDEYVRLNAVVDYLDYPFIGLRLPGEPDPVDFQLEDAAFVVDGNDVYEAANDAFSDING